MRTFDSDALECLAAIVEEGSSAPPCGLSVTQSAVSQRLRALEAQVGTVLLVRSRPVKPTSAGAFTHQARHANAPAARRPGNRFVGADTRHGRPA